MSSNEMPREIHYKRIEFIFIADTEEKLPDPEALRSSLEIVFKDQVLQVGLGHSIDTVNVLVGLLLATRGMIDPKQPKQSAQNFSVWCKERDQILNTLLETGQ